MNMKLSLTYQVSRNLKAVFLYLSVTEENIESVGSIRLAAEIFNLQSVEIGNGTPLSANMFIQIKQEHFPDQTSERKLRFNSKSVMSTERLILLAKVCTKGW